MVQAVRLSLLTIRCIRQVLLLLPLTLIAFFCFILSHLVILTQISQNLLVQDWRKNTCCHSRSWKITTWWNLCPHSMKQWWQNSIVLQHEHISSSNDRSALSRDFCSLDWGYHRMNSLKNLGTLKAAVMCVCTYVSKPCVYTPLRANSKTNCSMQQYRLGANWLKSSFTEDDLRAPVDKLSTSQHCLPFQQRPATSWAVLTRMKPAGQGKRFFP